MEDTMYIKTTTEFVQLFFQDIDYIDIVCDCCTFHLKNGSQFSCSKSLNKVESILPASFQRINRNCIINLYSLSKLNIKKRLIILHNGIQLQVSIRKMREISKTLSR